MRVRTDDVAFLPSSDLLFSSVYNNKPFEHFISKYNRTKLLLNFYAHNFFNLLNFHSLTSPGHTILKFSLGKFD